MNGAEGLVNEAVAPHEARLLQALLTRAFMLVDMPLALVMPDDRLLIANPAFEQSLGLRHGAAGLYLGELATAAARRRLATLRAAERRPLTDIELGGGTPLRMRARVVDLPETPGFLLLSGQASMPARLRMVGKIRCISLDEERAALGARWDRVAPRVLDTAEHMIRRRLDDGEWVERSGDGSFLICFANGDEAAASRRSAQIAREIHRHLLGEAEQGDEIGVSAVVSALRSAQPPDTALLTAHLEAAEAAARAANAEPPDAIPVRAAATGQVVATALRTSRAPPGAARQVYPEPAPARSSTILEAAAALAADGRGHPVLVDIPFEQFLNPGGTDRFTRQAQSLPPASRRHLWFVLGPPPSGSTSSCVAEVERRVRPLGSGFGLRLPGLAAPHPGFTGNGIARLDGSRWARRGAVPDAKLRPLVLRLRAQKMGLLVDGVGDEEAAETLARAGVDWITAPAADR